MVQAAAGFRVGSTAGSTRYVILEVHINNPSLLANVSVELGVRLYLTSPGVLRQYDAGSLIVGERARVSVRASERAQREMLDVVCDDDWTVVAWM